MLLKNEFPLLPEKLNLEKIKPIDKKLTYEVI
jgi:hypothetical protein